MELGGETPAARAIRLLTAKRIAHACDLTTDAVWKWVQRDGLIPARYQRKVLDLAAAAKVDFTADEIIGLAA